MPAAKRTSGVNKTGIRTRARIIARCKILFNRFGIQGVSIEQIAEALKMSPGNLTYHFKRKRDLIRATLETLQQELREALQSPAEIASAREGAQYILRVLRCMWSYRFFFNELAPLLTADAELRKSYAAFMSEMIDILEADLRDLHKAKILITPAPPNTLKLLAENIWGIWLHWLKMSQLTNPSSAALENQSLYNAAIHHWSLFEHWVEPQFARELLAYYQDVLLKK